MRLADRKPSKASEAYVAAAMRTVNGLENLVEAYWRTFESIVDDETRKANRRLRALISRLKADERGAIDFASTSGKAARRRFMRDAATIYSDWRAAIGKQVGSMSKANEEPWKASLGQRPHRPGRLLMRLRDEVVRKARQLMANLNHFDTITAEALVEARHHGVKSARITGRGLPRDLGAHSRTTRILLRGLKGIVDDQEKALLENTFRGLDALPRNHANMLFDATTGLPLKDALNALADDFSTGAMNKRQLKLSIQTHIRAMLRRVAMESERVEKIPGLKEFVEFEYVQIPPTRRKDLVGKASKSVLARAFQLASGPEIVRGAKGSGDSLGLYPGDRVIPVPVPKKYLEDVRLAAAEARRRFLEAQEEDE